MEALNSSTEYTCLYEISPVEKNGNRRESLIAHLNKTTHLSIGYDIRSWNWELRLVKSEKPMDTLAQAANKYFFEQKYSPKPDSNISLQYFLNIMREEISYNPLKVYEAITEAEEIWHELWWADYLIDAGGELYHLHFGATN